MTSPNSTYLSLSAQYGRLVSAAIPCEGVTLAGFLQAAQGQERFYWESSRENLAFAASGTALELVAWGAERFQTIQHRAMELFAGSLVFDEQEPLAAPRLFGGFSFHDSFVPDEAWSDFPPAHFVLAHYQLVRIGETYWLTINAHVPYGENPMLILPDLQSALALKLTELQAVTTSKQAPLSVQDLEYPMPYEVWERIINSATERIKTGELNKVVLSRVAELRFKQNVAVDAALDYLNHAYPETYRFLFEPRPYRAFYGATPELLAKVKHKRVETMALAGSIKRGTSPQEDESLAHDLMESEKDRYEHQIVIDDILTRLEACCKTVNVGKTGVMQLSNIQHLHTPISGSLQSADGVIPVIERLHPTPALGGSPYEKAQALIEAYEPVPRGWYAAPVGWIDRNLDGEFAVAIRSAVAQGKRVWLYAGAGIVAESEAQKEWDETALKFKPMMTALGADT